METFSALLALCAGNSPVTGEFPTKKPMTRSFDGCFWICAWINDWVNNREAGDLRRRRDHYDGTVMDQHRLDYSSWRMYASPGIELDNYSYDKNYESVSLLSTYHLSVSKRCRKYISVK